MLLRVENFCYSLLLISAVSLVDYQGDLDVRLCLPPRLQLRNLSILLLLPFKPAFTQSKSKTKPKYRKIDLKQIIGLTITTFIADILWIVYESKTLPQGFASISRTFAYSMICTVLCMIAKVIIVRKYRLPLSLL